MKIKKIHVENYKTYKFLDLDLEVTDDKVHDGSVPLCTRC